MGKVWVVRVYSPGWNTSAIWPSLTKMAICESRTVNLPPFWISISSMGYRYARTPSPGSVHWMTSINCFEKKLIGLFAALHEYTSAGRGARSYRVLNRIGGMHGGAGCEPAADWQSAC